MPSNPIMMVLAHPLRMIVVPPTAISPHMMVIPIAVVLPPFRISGRPFGMMVVNPARMVVMPPVRVVPLMMVVVPIAPMFCTSNRRRSREQGCQGRGGEKSS